MERRDQRPDDLYMASGTSGAGIAGAGAMLGQRVLRANRARIPPTDAARASTEKLAA